METRVFSAYNLARGVLLNCKLAIADNGHQPLKLLDIVISGMGMDATAGLWLTPLHAIPAVPRVFPFDLIYLDKDYRVLETAEMGPGIDFPAFRAEVASALVLPSDTLRSSQTASSDRLIVCPASDLQTLLAASGVLQPAKAPELRAAALSATETAPPIIELAPQRPVPGPSGPTTSPEHSILTAVAKTAQPSISAASIGLIEPPAPATNIQSEIKNIPERSVSGHQREPLPPEPSLEIADAGFERPRKVQAPIIEHHVDPEDLFSNWVVSPPPGARAERPSPAAGAAPPKAPAPKTATPARNGKQNGTKASASANVPAERSDSKVPDNPAPAVKSKAASHEKLPTPTRVGIPQLPPASTFTAIPYGMWQVSMPTAVAPVLPANQFSSKPTPAANGRNSANSAKSAPVRPGVAKTDVSAETTPVKLPSVPAALESDVATPVAPPASPAKSQPAAHLRMESERLEPAPKPADRKSAEKLAPGDFLASLQRKLAKIQQSKSATAPPSEHASEGSPAPAQAAPSLSNRPTASVSAVVQPGAKQTAAALPKSSPPADLRLVEPAIANPDLRSKPAPSSTQLKAKTESLPASLRSKFKHWLNPVATPTDRRRALRRYVPGMVAHYFTGGAPKPKEVADISMSGMYLLTDDRWMPGTMIQMTLQKPCARGERKQSMNVLSRIVRRGSDGVAIEFIMPEALSHISHDIQPSQATDKLALARFL